jgi:hypothetical protein
MRRAEKLDRELLIHQYDIFHRVAFLLVCDTMTLIGVGVDELSRRVECSEDM